MPGPLGHCAHWTGRLFAVLLFLLLAVVLLLTVLMPFAGNLQGLVEQGLAQAIDRPVKVASVEARWRGLQPVFSLSDVHLLDAEGETSVVHFDSVEAELAIVKSVLKLRLFVDNLLLRGTRLTIVHETDDRFYIHGFKRSGDSDPVPVHQVLDGLQGVRLKFRKLLLLWDDRPRGEEYELFATSLDVYAGKDEVGAEGEISLPANLGDGIRFKAVAVGPFEVPAEWDIDFYLRGNAIDLEGLPLKRPGALAQTESGVLDVELWGDWSSTPGLDVQGDLELYDLRVNEPGGDAGIARFTFVDELVTNFRITGDPERWRLDLDGLRLITPSKHWLQGGMSVGYDAAQQEYSGVVEYADLGSVAALATLLPGLSDEQRGALQDLNLSGEVSDLKFVLPEDSDAMDKIELSGAIAALGWAPVDRLPGIAGVSAEFNFADSEGWARLGSQELTLNAPRLFRQSLAFSRLEADLALRQDDGVLQIVADNAGVTTQDFQAIGTARLELSKAGERPRLDLEFISPGADLSVVKNYLPANIMPPKTLGWLDAAFIDGRASDARVTFNGPLSMAAFKSGETRLEAELHIMDGALHYQNNWPDISGISGTMAFHNAQLEAHVVQGQLFQTTLTDVDLNIPNLFRSELEVKGKASGPLVNGIDFIDQTPIGDGMHEFLQKVSANGDSELDLELHLPLTRKTQNKLSVNGRITMEDAYLALPDYDVEFEEITGVVSFTEREFSAKQIQAQFRGSPIATDIVTQETGDIVILSDGQFRAEQLLPQQTNLIQAAATGVARWHSSVTVPRGENVTSNSVVTLKVTSDLDGIALQLPEPFRKSADDRRNLQVEYEFSEADPELIITDQQYFIFRGIMDLEPEFKVQRAGVGLSGVNPQIPKNGIRVRGFWPVVDYSHWYDFIQSLPESDPDQANPIDLVDDISATIGRAILAEQPFDQLIVDAQKEVDNWQLKFDSPSVAGDAVLPVTLETNEAWRASLNHLNLTSDDEEPIDLEEVVDPALIPPLMVDIQKFTWGDRELENVRLVTSPQDNGMNIREFSMKSPLLQAVVNGHWLKNGARHKSSILLSAQGQDVGQVLTDLGLGTTLGSGTGTLKGLLEWDSVPYDLDFSTMDGSLEVDVADGLIKGVDPGLGRIIGLLSLDQLPRRLDMNFKDMSEEGFHYDTLRGKGVARLGMLTMERLDIDGSIASLSITGQTNLVEQQHDLALQLVPKFKSSVPVAAGLLAGPQAGVLVFIVDKLAEGMGVDLNESAALDFHISGSWEVPVIEPVEPEIEQSDDDDLYDIPLN